MSRRRGALAAHAAGVVVLGAAAVCVLVASRGGAVRASAVLSAAHGIDSKHPRGKLAEGVRAEPAASARHPTYADDAAGFGSRRSRSATGRAHSLALDAQNKPKLEHLYTLLMQRVQALAPADQRGTTLDHGSLDAAAWALYMLTHQMPAVAKAEWKAFLLGLQV